MRSKQTRRLALATLLALSASLMLTAPSSAETTVDFLYGVDCDPPLSIGDPYAYDDTHPAVKYNLPWKFERPGRGLYQGTQHITNYGGATASFVLPQGPYQFAYGFTKMRNAGKAAIYYNNQFVVSIDMYAETTTYNCALILYGGVPAGTFTVKVLNQKNPLSGGTYVNVDYIYYEP